MSAFTKAVHDRLAGNSQLAALLSSYNGSPAIFTAVPIPENAQLPWIVTEGVVSDEPWDTKTTTGREIVRDIRCYAIEDGSSAAIELIAERVRELFHLYRFTITGYGCFDCRASGPLTAPDEDGVIGLIITIRFIAIKI